MDIRSETLAITEHVLFVAGRLRLAVSTAAIHCIHDGLRIQEEPGTQSWFSGLAVADGRLIPVTDLGDFLTGQPSTGRIIELSRNIALAGFRVDAIVGVSRYETVENTGDQHIERVTMPGLSGRYLVNDGGIDYQLFDFAELVHSIKFTHISMATA